ncbi:MAG: Rpn family recombination-promoting nuclease/putative transposase [Clostridiales bacterium]|nr:Rpn family recombination-promoting nuclease/putative transposase [Clostridiales bacterium]
MVDKILLLPVTSDFIFKLIFGDQRNVDILAAFLRAVLDIPDEEYERLVIVDPYIKKESVDDKYGILDVKLHTVSGNVIHIEIQVRVLHNMKARTIYSQSKLVTEQMSSGMNWSDIKQTITIVITRDVFMPEGDKYHHQFRYRTEDGVEFSDLSEINTLDLNKLPAANDSTELWYWMKFIKTDDEEVLDMLAQRSPQMRKAVGVLKELSADERTRMLYEKREMARRDSESLAEAEREKWQIVVAKVVAEKDSQIAEKDSRIAEVVAEQESRIAEVVAKKDSRIAELEAQLAKQKYY